jgi:hypothetical protein
VSHQRRCQRSSTKKVNFDATRGRKRRCGCVNRKKFLFVNKLKANVIEERARIEILLTSSSQNICFCLSQRFQLLHSRVALSPTEFKIPFEHDIKNQYFLGNAFFSDARGWRGFSSDVTSPFERREEENKLEALNYSRKNCYV